MHKPRMSPLDPVHNVKEYKGSGHHRLNISSEAASLEITKRISGVITILIRGLWICSLWLSTRQSQRPSCPWNPGPSIAKGLQESIQAFRVLDTDVGLERILESAIPDHERSAFSPEVERRLPEIAGGLSLLSRAALRL